MISKEVSQLTEKRERIFTVTDEQIFKVCQSTNNHHSPLPDINAIRYNAIHMT